MPANAKQVICSVTISAINPAISISGTTSATPTKIGDTIPYSFTVTNTGNRALTSVGASGTSGNAISCPSSSLAVGASETCTATHTVTQADMDAGKVVNFATVSGTSPENTVVTASTTMTTTIANNPAIKLTASASSVGGLGDTVSYTVTLTNSGDQTVSSMALTDSRSDAITCTKASLAPGASTSCTIPAYTVTQADVTAGKVILTLNAAAQSPDAVALADSVTLTTTVAPAPAISISGTATGTPSKAGDKVSYSLVVTNTGNRTLSTVGVTASLGDSVSCPVSTLAPAAMTTCTASHTVTQAEMDGGTLVMTATAKGTSPEAANVTNTATVTSTPSTAPSSTTAPKSSSVSGNTATVSVTYTNTGNVTPTNIGASGWTCASTTLAPGASTTCTGSVPVTQADIDRGSVSASPVITAKAPDGSTVTSTVTIAVTLSGTASASFTASVSGTVVNAGDRLSYSATVTNAGTLTITSLSVSGVLTGSFSCGASSLAPGASTTCTDSLTSTQAQVDAGSISQTVSLSATPAQGSKVTKSVVLNSAIVSSPNASTFTVTAGSAPASVGGSLSYTTSALKNTGNVTLTVSSMTGSKSGLFTCTDTSLAPGESTTCTDSYAVTQADFAPSRSRTRLWRP
ncbi:MAG: hypothetical protein J0I14_10735 [Propionibacteriaceae bacterium]|nr:hypothetical protein [Propionibacteriaceae bacterium]